VELCSESDADIYVKGHPMRLASVREYFIAKNMAHWGAPVTPLGGENWDTLGDRLAARFGLHIWHPDHWKESSDV
jgi:hypothetical protein